MANRSHGRRFLGIGSSEVPTTRWADSDLLFGESPLVLPEDVAQYREGRYYSQPQDNVYRQWLAGTDTIDDVNYAALFVLMMCDHFDVQWESGHA